MSKHIKIIFTVEVNDDDVKIDMAVQIKGEMSRRFVEDIFEASRVRFKELADKQIDLGDKEALSLS